MLEEVSPNKIVAKQKVREDLENVLYNHLKISKEIKKLKHEEQLSSLLTFFVKYVKKEPSGKIESTNFISNGINQKNQASLNYRLQHKRLKSLSLMIRHSE